MILDTIVKSTRIRVSKAKELLPLEVLKELIYAEEGVKSFHGRNAFAFERALRKVTSSSKVSFICEVKKASPSKGVIVEDFPYLTIAEEYVAAGAEAISVLTEPQYFQGADRYLTEISRKVAIPVLRKDFMIDEYQIYEAKLLGADAVLLICALLDTDTIKKYLGICNELGLSALVEAHNKEEVESAMNAGARMIGVNNRNLKTFEVDINTSIELRSIVTKDIIYIAESGISTSQDITSLREVGVDAVLIGETLMRSEDKKRELSKFRD